jgi:hypothetical protein
VIEVARDDLERIGVENLKQLVVGETEPVLKLRGLQKS